MGVGVSEIVGVGRGQVVGVRVVVYIVVEKGGACTGTLRYSHPHVCMSVGGRMVGRNTDM